MPFDNHTTVQTALDEQVILVGEEHFPPGREHCRDLMQRVLEEYDPPTLAIEATRPTAGRSSGMGVAQSFASEEARPLVAIDDGRKSWSGVVDDERGMLDDANYFKEPITPDGDVPIESIDYARKSFREKFGEEASAAMHADRERIMAARLRHMVESDDFDTPIVAGIGTFHILALHAFLENENDTESPSERRIEWNDAQNADDGLSTNDTARSSANSAA